MAARGGRDAELRPSESVTARNGKYVSTSGSADTVNVFTAMYTSPGSGAAWQGTDILCCDQGSFKKDGGGRGGSAGG